MVKKVLFVTILIIASGCILLWHAQGLTERINKETLKAKEDNSALKLNTPIRIGYFHGGRIHVLYRNYVNCDFEKEGINVEFYTKCLYKDGWYKVPKSNEEMKKIISQTNTDDNPMSRVFGRATGIEIISAMDKGILEGGTVGESSFLYAISHGSQVVTVAILGHGSPEKSTRAIVVRKDVVIKTPKDFKGKRIISTLAGPGDRTCVREFIEKNGLDYTKDVTIIDQIPPDQVLNYLQTKKADIAFVHMHMVKMLEESGNGYLYQGMQDWMNPELAFALLVFRKDFIETHPELVARFIRAFMKRLKYEESLPEEEKFKKADFGLQIRYQYKNLTLPVWDYPPLVRMNLLDEVQSLLLKYKEMDKKTNLEKFVNNDFVRKAYEELK